MYLSHHEEILIGGTTQIWSKEEKQTFKLKTTWGIHGLTMSTLGLKLINTNVMTVSQD
jgi:hypothetical protein